MWFDLVISKVASSSDFNAWCSFVNYLLQKQNKTKQTLLVPALGGGVCIAWRSLYHAWTRGSPAKRVSLLLLFFHLKVTLDIHLKMAVLAALTRETVSTKNVWTANNQLCSCPGPSRTPSGGFSPCYGRVCSGVHEFCAQQCSADLPFCRE